MKSVICVNTLVICGLQSVKQGGESVIINGFTGNIRRFCIAGESGNKDGSILFPLEVKTTALSD